MMSIAVMVGVILASSNFLEAPLLDLIWGFVTGFMLTAASMAINDYYDKEIDAINEPNRPIPSGLINSREALVFALILTVIGFAAAYLTNIFCFVIAIIAWIVFVTYTTVGKRSGLPGNFLVSACVATPFIYGSVVIANAVGLNVLIFASMAFLSNTGREITKGIVDYLLAVLVSPIPRLRGHVSFWFIPLVAVTDFGLVASAFMLLRDCSRENARKVKSMVLLWFIFGLLAFIVGAVR